MRLAGKRLRVPAQLEWLDGALPGRIQLHICDSESVMIENHTCVMEFLPERVRVAGARGILTIEGERLALCEVRPGALIVRGRIRNIELPARGGES